MARTPEINSTGTSERFHDREAVSGGNQVSRVDEGAYLADLMSRVIKHARSNNPELPVERQLDLPAEFSERSPRGAWLREELAYERTMQEVADREEQRRNSVVRRVFARTVRTFSSFMH